MKINEKILPKYTHGKYGTFMFHLCANWTCFLVKHKVLYFILAGTWGIIMTVIGLLATLVCLILKLFGVTVIFSKYNWIYSISMAPDYWGGCEMGLMFFRDLKSTKAVDAHEFGHTFQNCLFGPLFPFLICIPSASRYWYQTIRKAKGKTNVPYDKMWFEDAASQCGEYANKYLNSNN